LILVGDGEETGAYIRLVEELGLGERVTLTGLQPSAAPFLLAADVVLLPSRREGLPVVALEALALARPVVATAVGGTPSVVRDGESGWLVPADDPEALARAVIDALGDRDEAERRGREGRALIEREYSAPRMLDRIERVLGESAGERRDPARVPPLKPRPYYVAASLMEDVRTAGARARRGGGRPLGPGLRILGYHRVSDDRDVLAVTPDAFRRQIAAILESEATVVRLEDALPLLDRPIDAPYVSLTFDDGYRDTLETALPILEQLGVPATLFLPTAMLDGRECFSWYRHAAPPGLSPAEVADLVAGGTFDVQSHSRTHPRLPALPDQRAVEEIEGSRDDLQRHLGLVATSFSYPAGLFGPRDAALVAGAGYRAGVTTRSGLNLGGASPWELHRTMIMWADGPARFTAKLTGLLDHPSALSELAQRRRTAAGERHQRSAAMRRSRGHDSKGIIS
jgi:peptidoglycan/xylan/chitin deacetylase (PgdA/CDA1 family)